MDLKRFEKDTVELNVNNLFNEKLIHHDHPKIENIRWSEANDRLRASGNTEHYTTIKDTFNEDTSPNGPTDEDITLNLSQRSEHPYLSFSGEVDIQNHVHNDNTGLYSYATSCDTRVQRFQGKQDRGELGNAYLSLNADNQSEQETSKDDTLDKTKLQNNVNHYDNNKALRRGNDGSPYHKQGTSQCSSECQYESPRINRKDTYLVPRQGKLNEFIQREESTYITNVRIPKNNETDVPDKRTCSKRGIILLAVVLLILLVTSACVVAVVMTTGSNESDDVCSGKTGCQSKCKKYPVVLNGHVNFTEDVSVLSSVHIICNEGFNIDGKDTALCLGTGQWDRIATCEPVDCRDYRPPGHVRIPDSGYETTFNTSISLICEPGFQFAKESDDFVWCNERGDWSGNPKCENLVNLTTDRSFFLIGETARLTCNFKSSLGWKTVNFRIVSRNNDSVTIATIINNVDSYKQNTSGDNIKITEPYFTHDSGHLVVTIETVQCSDAFEEPGIIEYTCDVLLDTSYVFRDIMLIRTQGDPGPPLLTVTFRVVEGEDADRFVCDMLFAEPDGQIDIESDYSGKYVTLLTSLNGEYENDFAWIEDIKNSEEECWYRMVVTFGLRHVTMEWHRKHIRCVAKTSNSSFVQTVLTSNSGLVKVIPDTFCNGQAERVHPYNCCLLVICDKEDGFNSVSEVKECQNKDYPNCKQCFQTGGCSITDIYFKDGGTNTVGSSLTIICIVEDFKDITNINITRGNGELVSSVNTGDNIKGFKTVQEMSYLNGTTGMLSVHVGHLACEDEATYRCSPEGGGKHSDDVVDLDIVSPKSCSVV